MKNSFAKALEQLQEQVQAGEQPDKLVVDDQEFSVNYDQDESGRFVEVWLRWPSSWFGVLDGGTWGGQEAVRYYYESWY